MSRDRRGQSWIVCLIVFHTSPLPCIQDLFLAEWNDWKFPPRARGGRWYIWDLQQSEIHPYFRCLMNTSFRIDAGSVLLHAHSGCFSQNICILIGYAGGLPTAEHLLCFTALRLAATGDPQQCFSWREEYQCFSARLDSAPYEHQRNSSQPLASLCFCTGRHIVWLLRCKRKTVIMSKGNNFQTSFSWCVLQA